MRVTEAEIIAAAREIIPRPPVGHTICVRIRPTFEPWTKDRYPTLDEAQEMMVAHYEYVALTPELFGKAFGE